MVVEAAGLRLAVLADDALDLFCSTLSLLFCFYLDFGAFSVSSSNTRPPTLYIFTYSTHPWSTRLFRLISQMPNNGLWEVSNFEWTDAVVQIREGGGERTVTAVTSCEQSRL